MPRIFDHIDGTPEDRKFSRAAHAMRKSRQWHLLPLRDEPEPVSGEFTAKELP